MYSHKKNALKAKYKVSCSNVMAITIDTCSVQHIVSVWSVDVQTFDVDVIALDEYETALKASAELSASAFGILNRNSFIVLEETYIRCFAWDI